MNDNTERTLYVAGPMKDYPENNYPAFNAAAKILRYDGWLVQNPAENPPGLTLEEYTERGIYQLLECGAIALLPGWRRSVGAKLELHIAQLTGKTIYLWTEDEQLREVKIPKVRTILTTPVGGAR